MGNFVSTAFKGVCLAKLRPDASSWLNVSSKFEGKVVTHNIQTTCGEHCKKWAQLHRVKASAVKGLQKIGVAVHNGFYCRLQKELLVFLLNLKINAVCGVFISLLEMRMHGLSSRKVSGKMRIQLRIASGITIGGKYQPTENRYWRCLLGN